MLWSIQLSLTKWIRIWKTQQEKCRGRKTKGGRWWLVFSHHWEYVFVSFKKTKKKKKKHSNKQKTLSVIKWEDWFETNFAFSCKHFYEGLLMNTDTSSQKWNRIWPWIACQKQKSCHIDPIPIKISQRFAIDFSGSKVFKCSKRPSLGSRKKGAKVVWMPKPNIMLRELSIQRLWEISFTILLNCRQRFPSAGANMLTIIVFIQT